MRLSNLLLLMATTALCPALGSAAWAQEATPAEDDAQGQVDVSVPGAGGLNEDDIVVIGQRIPNVVKSTPSVVSVLSQADIDRAGDGDIAGALQRVTGLSLVGGKYVYVRGLGERYSLALLNGLPIPSPEPLKRVVPLDLFPTDVLSSTLVQKSYSVNFPGEFGGGVINLTTKAVPEESFVNVSGSVSGDTVTTGQLGYTYWGSGSDWTSFDGGTRSIPVPLNAAMNSGKLIASGPNFTNDQLKRITASLANASTTLVQRNDTIPANMSLGVTGGTAIDLGEDRLGVIFAVNWSNEWKTREGIRQLTLLETAEGKLEPQTNWQFVSTENRIRLNGLLGLGYEFGEHKLRFTNLYVRDVLKQARVQTGIDNFQGPEQLNRTFTNWFERTLFSSSLVGEFRFNDVSLAARGTYAKSQRNAPYEREFRYVESILADGSRAFTNDLRSSGNGAFIAFSELEDTVWAGALDLGYELPFARPVTVSGGYAYTDNQRNASRRDFRYLPEEALPGGISQQRPDVLISDFNIFAYDILLRETSGATGVAAYEAGLKVHAGYGQVEAELADGLRLTAGVRYEKAEQFVQAIALFDGQSTQRTNLDNDYWLPAVTVTWNFAENMQLRLAASKTIARPQFRELAPQQYTDTDNDRISFGNPYLRDSELKNLEARYEWYFGQDERLTVGGFFKKIDKPIETITFSGGNSDVMTTFANAPRAELWGIETEVQKYFDLGSSGFLSDRRLFVSANYTYSQSKIKVNSGDITWPGSANGAEVPASLYFTNGDRMTGQSDHVANLQLGFQQQEKLSEQTLLLTYASDRATQRGPNDTPDLIEKPGLRLDFVVRQEVNVGAVPLELKAEVRNITGAGYEESQTAGGTKIYNNKYDVGTTFSLGVKAQF